MIVFYNISIAFYYFIIRIVSPFNSKAKLWLQGRRGLWERLRIISETNGKVIWIHCSSLGEFEQGRPVIERIKSEMPEVKIFLTFFSPSGYTVRKSYSQCDWVDYIPLDTKRNARKFLNLVKPAMVLFIKYEFWYHHLLEIKKRDIPAFLISANFRETQVFFKWYGSWYRKMLLAYRLIFVQNELSKSLLESIGYNKVCISGDTRFDRVKSIMLQSKEIKIAEEFSRDHFVIVAGSTWEKDEDLLFTCLKNSNSDIKIIIAPHEISKLHLARIKNQWNNELVFYSEASAESVKEAKVLLIDNVGMLSSLYKYGVIAYIGGGFGKGIHNVLEAATYGMPVIFGPNYRKFQEAVQLVELKAAFPVTDSTELQSLLDHFNNDKKFLKQASSVAAFYVSDKTGATETVLRSLKEQMKN
jgi:3-deoxy-D-manno-octulosonic-acid transferase